MEITLGRPWLPRVQPLAYEDDLPAPSQVSLDQEDAWRADFQALPWVSRPFLDEESGATLANFPLEQEEEVRTTRGPPFPWLVSLVAEEEAGVSPLVHLEQEEPWVAVTQTVLWSVWVVAQEEVWALSFGEQEEPWIAATQAVPWSVWLVAQEEARGFPAVGLEEEIRPPLAVGTILPPRAAVPFTEEETGGNLKNFAAEQEEPWVAVTQTVPWSGGVVAREEELARIQAGGVLEEEAAPFLPVLAAGAWTAQLFREEEVRAFPGVPVLEEEVWTVPFPVRPWLSLVFPDEAGTGFLPPGLEQEEVLRLPLVRTSWTATVWTEEEAGRFLGLVEPEALRWTTCTETVPWLAVLWADEEPGASLKNFALEQEEPWVARFQVIPWTAWLLVEEGLQAFAPTRLPAVTRVLLAAPLGRRLSLPVRLVVAPATAPLLTESGEFLLVEGSAVQTLDVEAMLRGRAQETVSITRRRVFPLVR